jgi:two-component system, NtrC family, sensor kinase
LAKVHMRKASIEVVLDLSEEIPTFILDFNQISQVIMNLIINAIDAMGDGGRLTLSTRLQQDPSAVLLLVSDTGPGILSADESRIFDPFFTRKPDGTGLGLSISRQILDRHGAFIEVNNASGPGCTFQVTFPLRGITEADPNPSTSE